MPFNAGDVIDDRYVVEKEFNAGGGMGALLFVRRRRVPAPKLRVLKYCTISTEEGMSRFRREVRLMKRFKGNSRVMQVVYSNLDHDPPYFVMDHFSDGDLTRLMPSLKDNLERQEKVFMAMIDCVAELHADGVFHRDIKPQNFLCSGDSIVVSDLGLSTQLESNTMATRSSVYWGTHGYLPPEFLGPAGFRDADAQGDIFMLGKTFYHLLSGREPTYFNAEGIPPALMVVIERCCAPRKEDRYPNLASLKQSLDAVYDVLLGRVSGSALATRTLRSITDKLSASSAYDVAEVSRFMDALVALDDQDQAALCQELPTEVFPILADEELSTRHRQFLRSYAAMAAKEDYGWAFATTIARNMRVFFAAEGVSDSNKINALETAIDAARRMNRFAAMDVCREMVRSVDDEGLAQRVHDLIHSLSTTFISDIEPATCRAPAIRAALRAYQGEDPKEDDDEL